MKKLIFALVSLILTQIHAAVAVKPNILISYSDDMGWAQLGVYGGKLKPPPNIDSLAAHGVHFTNGYSSSCICPLSQ